ncbi:TPA: hypothetical protein ACGUVT_001554 [Vibrio vulnificus]
MEGSLEGLPEAQRLQQELKGGMAIMRSLSEAALNKFTGLDMPETKLNV